MKIQNNNDLLCALRLLNEEMFNDTKSWKRNDLSEPLLVSQTIKKNTIMYIGQEVNTWNIDYKDCINKHNVLKELEIKYEDSLSKGGYGTTFWKPLAYLYCESSFLDSVIWANCFICGQRANKGTPIVTLELLQCSLNYLLGLYRIYKPKKILIVAGSGYPYYIVIEKFLREIGVDAKALRSVDFKKQEKRFVSFESIHKDVKVFWTDHPSYLQRKKLLSDVNCNIKTFFDE